MLLGDNLENVNVESKQLAIKLPLQNTFSFFFFFYLIVHVLIGSLYLFKLLSFYKGVFFLSVFETLDILIILTLLPVIFGAFLHIFVCCTHVQSLNCV